ncbi:hypothetical protein DFH11DRAFT_1612409 [Phellopilus nigrolimitatus]|nr:hypothetical protein DFH11DRAFT_1612409 [Phellopilus nigrolimitatus]
MPRLTEYELERQANIERNQKLMMSLGILDAEVAPKKPKPKSASGSKENKKPPSRKRQRASDGAAFPAPRRRSARLSAPTLSTAVLEDEDNFPSTILNSDPIDFLSTPPQLSSGPPGKRAAALRRLSPPPIPERVEEDTEDEEFDPDYLAPLPTRDASRTLRFADAPHFAPNMTPEEVIRAGSFGGTAFRRHYSSVLQRTLSESDYTEFPSAWYANLDVHVYLTAAEYDPRVNRYRVKAGQTLEDWERAGWIHEQDPRGWFQWYCRFYMGRRTRDDERQIKRWLGVCGPSGRFKRSLVKKIAERSGQWDDETVSPILRQTLQHWGCRLTEADYETYL